MRIRPYPLVLALLFAGSGFGQVVPELLYYKFNEGSGTSAVNSAFPGAGTPIAPIVGSLNYVPGQFGTGLAGTGLASASNHVVTGYTLNLQNTSWTLEFWYQPQTGTGLQYLCGVPVGLAFRAYSSGPGSTIFLTGSGISSVGLSNAAPAAGSWVHVAWVFDNSVAPPVIRGYVNGALVNTVSQTGALTLNTGMLLVGGQISNGLNGTLDEFRLWARARTTAEIAASYNTELFPNNILTVQTSGMGTGDLSLSLTALSPGASEGFVLITAFTSLPVGMGPLAGIVPDGLTWAGISFPLAPGNPFHFPAGVPGVFPDQPFNVGPGTLGNLAGITLDAVALVFGPGLTFLGRSNVQRVTF